MLLFTTVFLGVAAAVASGVAAQRPAPATATLGDLTESFRAALDASCRVKFDGSELGFVEGLFVDQTEAVRDVYTKLGAKEISVYGGTFRPRNNNDNAVDASNIATGLDDLGFTGGNDVALCPVGSGAVAIVDAGAFIAPTGRSVVTVISLSEPASAAILDYVNIGPQDDFTITLVRDGVHIADLTLFDTGLADPARRDRSIGVAAPEGKLFDQLLINSLTDRPCIAAITLDRECVSTGGSRKRMVAGDDDDDDDGDDDDDDDGDDDDDDDGDDDDDDDGNGNDDDGDEDDDDVAAQSLDVTIVANLPSLNAFGKLCTNDFDHFNVGPVAGPENIDLLNINGFARISFVGDTAAVANVNALFNLNPEKAFCPVAPNAGTIVESFANSINPLPTQIYPIDSNDMYVIELTQPVSVFIVTLSQNNGPAAVPLSFSVALGDSVSASGTVTTAATAVNTFIISSTDGVFDRVEFNINDATVSALCVDAVDVPCSQLD